MVCTTQTGKEAPTWENLNEVKRTGVRTLLLHRLSHFLLILSPLKRMPSVWRMMMTMMIMKREEEKDDLIPFSLPLFLFVSSERGERLSLSAQAQKRINKIREGNRLLFTCLGSLCCVGSD